jgi:hypothetical protein
MIGDAIVSVGHHACERGVGGLGVYKERPERRRIGKDGSDSVFLRPSDIPFCSPPRCAGRHVRRIILRES